MILHMFNRPCFDGFGPSPFLPGGIDRFLSDVFDVATLPTPYRRNAFPAVNVAEDGDRLYVEAELPGLKLEDIEIFAHGHELEIKGERRSKDADGDCFSQRECRVGPFSRVIHLPVEIDLDRVEARLENGVLTVKLPKAQAALPRKIKVAT